MDEGLVFHPGSAGGQDGDYPEGGGDVAGEDIDPG